jgi:miniconductance mechanosensitive channel
MGESLKKFFEACSEWLTSIGLNGPLGQVIHVAILMALLLFLGFLIDRLSRSILKAVISRIVKRTSNIYDDILLEKGVFHRIAHLVPGVFVFYMIPQVFGGIYAEVVDETAQMVIKGWIEFFKNVTAIYMIVISVMIFFSVLNASNTIFKKLDVTGRIPIKGYIQFIEGLLVLIAAVWILSILFNFHLRGFFTGLGAFIAVVVLVFRDTLLGLVASIQLSVSKAIRIGDWITIPSRNADGVVMDITVNTVRIENFDMTITTLPTYALVSEHVQNWRGMKESNGRRIKRFVNIDMGTVHFCDEEQLDRLEKITLLTDYIQQSRKQIAMDQAKKGVNPTLPGYGSNLTNLGLYLHNHPKIQQDMTFLVRQLQPTDRGIPMEVYVFCSDKGWENYESIQSDLFDHILAVMPEFDLRVFQGLSGQDVKQIAQK